MRQAAPPGSMRATMSEPTDGDLTVGDLAVSGARLGLYCGACGRFRYMKVVGLADDQNVKAIADKLSCIRCWSSEVTTRAVRRDPRTGFWPAESA
jgi:hypothetical protein